MRQIPGVQSHGGAKSWCIEGLWVDMLGEMNYRAEKDLAVIETKLGEVTLIPVEDSLVGRGYAARKQVSGYDEKDDDCAKKLMAAVLMGHVPIDWQEAYRVAGSSKYNCVVELSTVKKEVEDELANIRLLTHHLRHDADENHHQTRATLDLGTVAGGPCGAASRGESRGAEEHPADEK